MHEDRDLLQRFRRGERKALREVYDRYVDDVLTVVRSGVRVRTDDGWWRAGRDIPEDEVEALVQETFAKAYAETARKNYDGLRPYGAYLATIARNLVLDRGRRLARERKRVVHGIELDELPDEAPEAGHQQEAAELARVLAAFSGALRPPADRLYELRHRSGLSIERAAQKLGISVSRVRRIDAQMRVALLSHLRAHGFLENAQVKIGKRFLKRRDD